MPRTLLLYFLGFLLYVVPASTLIIPAKDLENFKQELATLDSQALVVFDVDETLITPKDPFLRYLRQPPPNCKTVQEGFGILDCLLEDDVLKGWKEVWFSRIMDRMVYQLLDPEFPSIIHQLQKNGIRTIALTAIKSHSFGIIQSMEDWRIRQLQQFNISFSQAFPKTSYLAFELPSGRPTFKQGVLCADTTPKGEALLTLLRAIEWTPSKIVFIDDSFSYQKSMESLTEMVGIPFTGFHYKGGELISSDFDSLLTTFRFRYLAENGVWLTEAEASALVDSK